MSGSNGPVGRIAGYASLFGVMDLVGDIVERGAFAQSLRVRSVKFLYQHEAAEPIGVFTELQEDTAGLFVRGEINRECRRGRDAYALLSQGALSGFSIGFNVRSARKERGGGRRLLAVDLWEISLVTFPMLPGAQAHADEGDDHVLAARMRAAGRTLITSSKGMRHASH